MITFDNQQMAVSKLREFYTQNNPGESLSCRINDVALDFIAEIVRVQFSMVHNKPKAFKLHLEGETQADYNKLKAFANQLHTSERPVETIFIKKMKSEQTGGWVISSTEGFAPSSQRNISVGIFGNSATSYVSYSSSATRYKPPVEASDSSSEETIKTLSFKKFVEHCDFDDDDIVVHADNCTFEKRLRVRSDIKLTNVVVKDSVVSIEGSLDITDSTIEDDVIGQKSVKLKDSFAPEVRSKGTLDWTNSKKIDQEVKTIYCDLGINLKGVNAKKVVSKNDGITAIGSRLEEVQVAGSVTLTDAKITRLTVKIPLVPLCKIVMENSSIDEIVFEEDNRMISVSKNGDHTTCGYPPSFNWPRKGLQGDLSSDASGRIEGVPYQLVNGEYLEGIKVTIIGTGNIGTVSLKNCVAQQALISEAITRD